MGGANIDKIRKLDEQASMDKINAQNGVLAGNGQQWYGAKMTKETQMIIGTCYIELAMNT